MISTSVCVIGLWHQNKLRTTLNVIWTSKSSFASGYFFLHWKQIFWQFFSGPTLGYCTESRVYSCYKFLRPSRLSIESLELWVLSKYLQFSTFFTIFLLLPRMRSVRVQQKSQNAEKRTPTDICGLIDGYLKYMPVYFSHVRMLFRPRQCSWVFQTDTWWSDKLPLLKKSTRNRIYV